MTLKHKISLGTFILVIIIPLLYLAYDRSLMPPMPEYQSPPYVPGETWEQYASRFYESSKKPNALAHYLKAYSLFSSQSYIYSDGAKEINTIFSDRWTKPYPNAEKLLAVNQPVIDEIIAGVNQRQCEFPPVAVGKNAPYFEFKYTFANMIFQKLFNVLGKKMESEKKYQQALDYYLYNLQFTTDILRGKQSVDAIFMNIAFMEDNTKPILKLVINNKLKETDYRHVISAIVLIDHNQVRVADQVHLDYSHIPWKERNQQFNAPLVFAHRLHSAMDIGYLAGKSQQKGNMDKEYISQSYRDMAANPKYILSDLYLAGYVFFNKGRIERNFYEFINTMDKLYTTKSYPELMKVDWNRIVPKDRINYVYSSQVSNTFTAYREQMIETVLLRQTQIMAAIQVYRLEKKKEPNGWDELKPYLSAIPIDAFTDKPFIWSKDSTGRSLVYSVGPDLKDDAAKIIYDPTNGTTSRGDIIPN
jgi:hypothetical protein